MKELDYSFYANIIGDTYHWRLVDQLYNQVNLVKKADECLSP